MTASKNTMFKFMSSKLPLLLVADVFLLMIPIQALENKQTYIVYMGVHSNRLKVGDVDRVNKIQTTHRQFLASFLESKEKVDEAIIHSYTGDINGFVAVLDEDEAAQIKKHPNVVSVFPDEAMELHTTHSWQFLSLEKQPNVKPKRDGKVGIWKRSDYGNGIIIANLDTGVWPKSKSFSNGHLGAVPSRWKGSCQNHTSVPCNRKLIGAKYFNKSYKTMKVLLGDTSPTEDSALDEQGHGSHTLSTAGGNFVRGANIFGVLNGTAKGGSPKARVASYKVCWPGKSGGCYMGDTLSGFEAAIEDGVDVVSASLGMRIPVDYAMDSVAIGSFHAVRKGIVVVCSAGNSGPLRGTVTNVAPWIITVGASTTDRKIVTNVELGNGRRFEGTSVTEALPGGKLYPLISSVQAKAINASEEDALLCKSGALDPKKVKGKILVCLRGDNPRLDKGIEAARAGAVGMILCNDEMNGDELNTDFHVLPSSHITYKDGLAVFAYINSTRTPLGYISPASGHLNTRPSPTIAGFSSRGPNLLTTGILKPDVTAPGVDIIAAYPGDLNPTDIDLDPRRTSFQKLSGTSMACPHVAGVVALLKKVHPHWGPAAIKSAIMTTAKTWDNTANTIRDSFGGQKATPFDFGGGHIRPNLAADPGLVYDSGIYDYLYFLCAIGYSESDIQLFSEEPYECPRNADLLDFNYPSISVPDLQHDTVTVRRTIKNVGSPGVYTSRVRHPQGVLVTVEPETLEFKEIGEEKSFKLTLKRTLFSDKLTDPYQFGQLEWSDGIHHVRSPIAVGH